MARKRSGKWLASVAGTALRSRRTPKTVKSVAGSYLAGRKGKAKRS
jgi:hypothetical protein